MLRVGVGVGVPAHAQLHLEGVYGLPLRGHCWHGFGCGSAYAWQSTVQRGLQQGPPAALAYLCAASTQIPLPVQCSAGKSCACLGTLALLGPHLRIGHRSARRHGCD